MSNPITADVLRFHGRDDTLNLLVEDRKRLKHSEREALEAIQQACRRAATEIDRLNAELLLHKDALWKACGDDEDVVNATLESQRP